MITLQDNVKSLISKFCSGKNCFDAISKCPVCDANIHSCCCLFVCWGFYHLECKECGLIFIFPEPTGELLDYIYDNLEYYTEWLFLVEKPVLEAGTKLNYGSSLKKFNYNVDAWYSSILDSVSKFQQYGRWLDVGGSTGRFVNYINHHSRYLAYLCEANSKAVQLAKEHSCTNIVSLADLESGQYNNTFQVISLIAVLEHIPGTLNLLKKLEKLLVPGGIIYIAVPRLGYFARHISKSIEYDINPPMHLRFFSRKTFRVLEKQLGGSLKLISYSESHGKRFHIGHLLKPDWYTLTGIVPEFIGDSRKRIVVNPPSTLFSKVVFQVFDIIDKLLSPITGFIDGQRMLHVVWIKK